MKLSLFNTVFLFLFCLNGVSFGEVGEFTIPAVIPLNDSQLENLRELVENDVEARRMADAEVKKAEAYLGNEPNPLEVIHYEGLVNTNPKRIACVEHLRDMTKAAQLYRYWQVSGDPHASETIRDFVTAWFDTYKLTGNDVNENKLYPLLIAYLAFREEFSADDRNRLDNVVENLGKLHLKGVKRSKHLTNRYSKHVRLLAVCGMILNREDWVEKAVGGIERFVEKSLYEDGSSKDFKYRDTLTYHGSSLRPHIQLCMVLGEKGRELYSKENTQGGSLKKSVDFVVPYAMGEKVHKEWVNTKVGLDRKRAAAGIEKYRTGRLFEPKGALRLMEEASFYDSKLIAVVRHLTDDNGERFPTWQTLVNAAASK